MRPADSPAGRSRSPFPAESRILALFGPTAAGKSALAHAAARVLDGEIVVLRQGKPDFGLLLSRNQARASFRIQLLARVLPVTYVVFDLLYERYESLLAQPLSTRRKRQEKLIQGCAPPLVFSQGVVGSGKAFFAQICHQGLEGMMAKRLASR